MLLLCMGSTSYVLSQELTKNDSINIDKVNATKKLYREIRKLNESIKKINFTSQVIKVDSTDYSHIKDELAKLQVKIQGIENQREYIPKKSKNPNRLLLWGLAFLIFSIGVLLGYLFKKKVQ